MANKFILYLKKHWIVVINILIIAFSFYFIWHSEKFQEKIAPKNFWENKVNNLESSIKKDRLKIKNLELSLEKEKSFCEYHAQEAEIQAEASGQDFNRSLMCINEEHRKRLDEIQNELKELKQNEKEIEQKLMKAIGKLKSVSLQ